MYTKQTRKFCFWKSNAIVELCWACQVMEARFGGGSLKRGLKRLLEMVGQGRAGPWGGLTQWPSQSWGPGAEDRSGYSLKPQVVALASG